MSINNEILVLQEQLRQLLDIKVKDIVVLSKNIEFISDKGTKMKVHEVYNDRILVSILNKNYGKYYINKKDCYKLS